MLSILCTNLENYYLNDHLIRMSTPIISVIVITYNQENTIKRTLDSILNQELSESFEIIIGDDCSSDKTPFICDEYKAKYPDIITVIHNKKNKGLRDNYYDCILEAKGEYIADCAGDDFWIDSQKLQKQLNIMRSNSNVSLVHTGWQFYDSNTQKFIIPDKNNSNNKFKVPIIEKGGLILPILLREEPVIIHLCTSLYRKDIFLHELQTDEYLFRNKEFTCEDIQIEIIMSAHGEIAYIPDITLAYQIGVPSASSEESFLKTFKFYFGTLKLNRYIQLKYNLSDTQIKPYYNTIIPYLYSQLFYSGNKHYIVEFESYIKNIPFKKKFKTYIYKFLLDSNILYNFIHKFLKKNSK